MKNFIKHFALVLVFIFGFFLFLTSYNIAGVRSFIVKSGSMEPAISTGSIVVTQSIHPSYLKQGDVITFIRPTEERDFITHRVLGIATRNDYISITTKGDKNNVADSWQVGGGNVIGKVYFSIPWLGYVLSFVQSKLGILLFILIPAIYILVEEISSILNMFRKKTETTTLLVALIFGIAAIQTTTTQALLNDKAILSTNTFQVVPRPTIPPTTNTCGETTTVNISGNAAGSTNTVIVNNHGCEENIYQSNNTSANATVQIETHTNAISKERR
jgi:signal peptidase